MSSWLQPPAWAGRVAAVHQQLEPAADTVEVGFQPPPKCARVQLPVLAASDAEQRVPEIGFGACAPAETVVDERGGLLDQFAGPIPYADYEIGGPAVMTACNCTPAGSAARTVLMESSQSGQPSHLRAERTLSDHSPKLRRCGSFPGIPATR